MGYPQHLYSDRRFVAHGVLYVCSAWAFMALVVTSAGILGARVTEYRCISFGVVGKAMLFFAAGISLLASFVLRHWRFKRKLLDFGRPGWSRDLWDDHLDG
jgi:hypothetical protein